MLKLTYKIIFLEKNLTKLYESQIQQPDALQCLIEIHIKGSHSI